MTDTTQDNALLQIIKSARVKGKDYIQIEAMYGVPAARAEAIMKAHYKDRVANLDPHEARMLQLDRLESLIDVLMSMAQMGNIKSAEVLLKNLEQINTLLGLNLEAERKAIQILTDDQAAAVYQIVSSVADGLLEAVTAKLEKERPDDLAVLEDGWNEMVAISYRGAVEEFVEAEVVE